MYCRICGDEEHGVKYRSAKRQALCDYCNRDTPPKAGREAFDRIYWRGSAPNDPPEGIRREFYADYLASACKSVTEYLEQTTSYTL